jgi:2-amino-4-hydroxy-6-hydroxymethyldihydropteridine diphosphokinase
MQAWLGLGANLQQPVLKLKEAVQRLGQTVGIDVSQVSSFYLTPPWGDAQQEDFVNAVVQIDTCLDSHSLLHTLQSIENTMGRQRSGKRWGPRLIDIDLLLFGSETISSAELAVPHPHMHTRAFVLVPLAELDEGLEIPGHGTVGSLLSRLDCSEISLLEENAGELS